MTHALQINVDYISYVSATIRDTPGQK